MNRIKSNFIKFATLIIKKLENFKINPFFLILYIFIVIQIRNILESFSDLGNVPFIQLFVRLFLHYTPWYFLVIILFSIVIYIFTKEKISKIFKTVSLFTPIIWFAPILDLILTGGARIGYIRLYTLHDILYNLFSWLWAQHTLISVPGVTTGMIIELTLMFLLLFSYVYIKSKSLIKAIVSFLIFYLIGFFMGSFPFLIPLLLKLVNLEQFSIQESFLQNYSSATGPDVAASIFIFAVLIISLIIIFYLYDKKKFSYFFRYASKTRIIHYLILLNSGIALAIIMNLYAIQISYLSILIILLANFVVFLSWTFAKFINDYFDQTEDSISNKNNPFIGQQINKNELIFLYSLILVLIITISYLISYEFFFLSLITIGISLLYSCPPLRLKRIIFLSNLCIGLASGFVFLQGIFLVTGNIPLSGMQSQLFLMIIFIFFLGSNLKDIKDYSGDKKGKILTLPTLLGEKKSKLIISVMLSFAFFLSVIILNLINLIPIAIICSIAVFYFINKKRYRETPVFVVYFIFFIILSLDLLLKLLNIKVI